MILVMNQAMCAPHAKYKVRGSVEVDQWYTYDTSSKVITSNYKIGDADSAVYGVYGMDCCTSAAAAAAAARNQEIQS